jgi:hypothetical protein
MPELISEIRVGPGACSSTVRMERTPISPRFPLIVAGALLALVLPVRPARASPIVGAELTYTGGAVTVESLSASSAYISELRLYDSSFASLMFLMLNDSSGGTVVTFDPSALGVAVGADLMFGIRVLSDANREYFMGPASRNADGVFHAQVDSLGGGQFVVGFEDLFGGGDLDYNDNRFKVTESPTVVPEPGTLSLMALGLGTLVRRRFHGRSRPALRSNP